MTYEPNACLSCPAVWATDTETTKAFNEANNLEFCTEPRRVGLRYVMRISYIFSNVLKARFLLLYVYLILFIVLIGISSKVLFFVTTNPIELISPARAI